MIDLHCRVHYPIPLTYSGPPDPLVMQNNIRKLMSEVSQLKNAKNELQEELEMVKTSPVMDFGPQIPAVPPNQMNRGSRVPSEFGNPVVKNSSRSNDWNAHANTKPSAYYHSTAGYMGTAANSCLPPSEMFNNNNNMNFAGTKIEQRNSIGVEDQELSKLRIQLQAAMTAINELQEDLAKERKNHASVVEKIRAENSHLKRKVEFFFTKEITIV